MSNSETPNREIQPPQTELERVRSELLALAADLHIPETDAMEQLRIQIRTAPDEELADLFTDYLDQCDATVNGILSSEPDTICSAEIGSILLNALLYLEISEDDEYYALRQQALDSAASTYHLEQSMIERIRRS
jgi:hypothetical protein